MRKRRQCPHCKSKLGFEVSYSIHGSCDMKMDFKGKVKDIQRTQSDDIDRYAMCLNCKRSIPTEELQTD